MREFCIPTGLALSLALACCCLCSQAASAQKALVPEYQVKAAFLFNFAKFVEWPPASFSQRDQPLQIGIIGEDPFGEVLDKTVQNKMVNNHSLVLRRLKSSDDPSGCHVLFICRSEQDRASDILARVKGQSMLLVSEIDHFLELGGMIHFYVESDLVKFSVNRRAVEQASLSMSSKLLAIAKIVPLPSRP